MRVLSLLLLGVVLAWGLLARHEPGASTTTSVQTVLRVPQDYPTIQAAIDAAQEGATIRIALGTYRENLTITKSLTLEGSGADPLFSLAATNIEPLPDFQDQDGVNPVITLQPSPERNIELRLRKLVLHVPKESTKENAAGIKILTGGERVSLIATQTAWSRFYCALAATELQHLALYESIFKDLLVMSCLPRLQRERFISERLTVDKVELTHNTFEGSGVLGLGVRKQGHFNENTITGWNGGASLFAIEQNVELELLGNVIASTDHGLKLGEYTENTKALVKGNWLLKNQLNLVISAGRQLNALIEENSLVGGNIGMWISIRPEARAEIRVHKNYIARQQMNHLRIPESDGVSDGQGIEIHTDDERAEGARIEISDNVIENNEGWGIAAECYRDVNGVVHVFAMSAVLLGAGNSLKNNKQGDLCPANYPWPPGFRK